MAGLLLDGVDQYDLQINMTYNRVTTTTTSSNSEWVFIDIRVVSKRSRTRSNGVPVWKKVKPVVKADRSEKSWKFDQTTVKRLPDVYNQISLERPSNLFFWSIKTLILIKKTWQHPQSKFTI